MLLTSDEVSELLPVSEDAPVELSDDAAEAESDDSVPLFVPLLVPVLPPAQPVSNDAHTSAPTMIFILAFILSSVRKNMFILLYNNPDR